MRSEENHVPSLGEHHPIGCERPLGMHDCDADRALQHASVGDDESLHSLARDTELLEHCDRHPGELATRIDKDVIDRPKCPSSGRMLDGDSNPEAAHVGHVHLQWAILWRGLALSLAVLL